MTTYYEYVFGFTSDIYELLAKGYGHYDKNEFIQLLTQAKLDNDELKEENSRLKQEIATMNQTIVATLERDLNHMRKTMNKIIKPKYNFQRTVEQLDV